LPFYSIPVQEIGVGFRDGAGDLVASSSDRLVLWAPLAEVALETVFVNSSGETLVIGMPGLPPLSLPFNAADERVSLDVGPFDFSFSYDGETAPICHTPGAFFLGGICSAITLYERVG
jgi:hypothetical protein